MVTTMAKLLPTRPKVVLKPGRRPIVRPKAPIKNGCCGRGLQGGRKLIPKK